MKNSYILLTATALVALVAGTSILVLDGDSGAEEVESSIQKFDSEEEFREYVSTSSRSYGSLQPQAQTTADSDQTGDVERGEGSSSVERSSETNIQVSGVGEPDILKNTGERIFYSPEDRRYWREGSNKNTSVFNTLPAEEFAQEDKIPDGGRMFLTNDSIISLGQNITAYSRDNYEKKWNEELEADIEAARKLNGKLYFVMEEYVGEDNPCPVKPMDSVEMPCTSYYHPESGDADRTYTLIEMDAESGEVLNKNGFVGSSSNTIVYVSDSSIYLTYSESISDTDLMLDFIEDKGTKYLDSQTLERIEQIRDYNISDRSLENEIQRAIRNYFDSINGDREEERKKLEEAMTEYTAERKRELTTTSIAKFNLDLELESEGEVPGELNDRFSIDESEEGLRVSTTVGNSFRFDVEPENDLYTLDHDLERQGSVTGMGLNEEIYSTRYIDDRAYVVTFRRVDPFHVIDLSNPENPELKGELKLPGFSSYLHPLQEDRILGIGEENRSVKAVIFDVEDDEPEVLDSMVLDDYYSEISDSHHAFQIDRENKVFFLPGSEGGHFFNYEDGLEEVKEVEMEDPKRAAFVNQNFYVFSDYNASVIDIENWKTIKQIQYREEKDPGHVPLPEPRIVR